MTHGTVHWSECVTGDVEAAKAHYAAMLGWTFEGMEMEGGTYWVAKLGDTFVAGLMSRDSLPGVPAHWMTYLAVDDLDAALQTAKETGGRVEREPWDVPGVGRIAMVSEPGGALAGIMQPASA